MSRKCSAASSSGFCYVRLVLCRRDPQPPVVREPLAVAPQRRTGIFLHLAHEGLTLFRPHGREEVPAEHGDPVPQATRERRRTVEKRGVVPGEAVALQHGGVLADRRIEPRALRDREVEGFERAADGIPQLLDGSLDRKSTRL